MACINQAALTRIYEICDSYADEKTPLIMILSDIQKEFGYIPVDVQEAVSEYTEIPVPEIHGVVTFYSFFSQVPKGKYVIGCCLGTACYVKGAGRIIDQFSEILGIEPGGTTGDGLFSIDALRCLGACAAAPAVTINGRIHSRVRANQVAGIIARYRDSGGEQ
ncbi:MAG: NAD(P)H-dependent oxidoreductase subunit E [Eubacteriales bacterium]|nr:NAD(P)H-dependent oxidoreductase subunit E [Sarcina sp.]MBR2728900.1 NAD(P)H-dependent oxidoreductase subunit E [Lachnospiraceae bacterium]MBR3188170.1 NAD(P)H-dependent oxidoreductase subunit E [Lachnospiraceae bacterium]MDO4416878.1 NAD(P)H-dependent oxidoreductase subunit E [Eubacteriales bacterium]